MRRYLTLAAALLLLNASLTFSNVWPTPAFWWAGELSIELGIFLAALVTRALDEFDVRFSIPWGQLVVLAVVAVVVGIVAAIAPARRAAKLNPLEALQYE